MEWLERLDRVEISSVTRRDIDVELTPLQIKQEYLVWVVEGGDLRNFGYSLTLGHGCGSANPNYWFGYDRTFPHHTNSSEIWLQANSSGETYGRRIQMRSETNNICTYIYNNAS